MSFELNVRSGGPHMIIDRRTDMGPYIWYMFMMAVLFVTLFCNLNVS